MDEKQLAERLSAVKAPPPSPEAKQRALQAALAAFDQNINQGKINQGEAKDDRLTDNETTSRVGRFVMQKRSALSGMGGAVALCALVAVLGSNFYLREMSDVEHNASNVFATNKDIKERVGIDAVDPEIAKKIQKQNELEAKAQATKGGSAIPRPINAQENSALTLPAAPAAPAVDPLAEWRQKTEAKRVQMENDAAPEEKSLRKEPRDKEIAQAAASPPVNGANKPPAKEADEVQLKASAPQQNADDAKMLQGQMQNLLAVQTGTPSGGAGGKDIAAPEGAPGGTPPSSQPIAITGAPSAVDTVAETRERAAGVAARTYTNYGYDQRYGQALDTAAFPDFEDSPVQEVDTAPVSTFSLDVDTSSYSFVRRMIDAGRLPPKGAVRVEELVNYFPYDYAPPSKEEDPFRPTIAVYGCPWKPTDKLVHIGLKASEAVQKQRSNIVFLIDTSGSMNAPDRLPLVTASFKLLLDSLQPDDLISVVTYAGTAGVALEPTKVSDRAKIVSVLDGLYAEGSTAGYAGLGTAYDLAEKNLIKGGNNRIILATDGDFNVGISDPAKLKEFISRKRDGGVALSVLGVGQDNYHDTTMQALAKNGNGFAAYIDNLNEARKVLMEEAGSTLYTVAKDAKVQVEFNPATVQEYRLIGYETRNLNRDDFNNDRVDAGYVGAGHAVTAIYEITPAGAPGSSDALRYAAGKSPVTAQSKAGDKDADKTEFSNEYAFLKIRYKRPDEDQSRLLSRPISVADEKPFAAQSDDVRFAAAVAGFGQVLRESKYTTTLTWDQLIAMAENARGKDMSGYRAEFVNLLRLAKAEAGAATPATPAAPAPSR
jgi:Ca-activated chloride channel family protein